MWQFNSGTGAKNIIQCKQSYNWLLSNSTTPFSYLYTAANVTFIVQGDHISPFQYLPFSLLLFPYIENVCPLIRFSLLETDGSLIKRDLHNAINSLAQECAGSSRFWVIVCAIQKLWDMMALSHQNTSSAILKHTVWRFFYFTRNLSLMRCSNFKLIYYYTVLNNPGSKAN